MTRTIGRLARRLSGQRRAGDERGVAVEDLAMTLTLTEALREKDGKLSRNERAFGCALEMELSQRERPRVAVLVSSKPSRIGTAVEAAYPRARVVVIDVGGGVSSTHAQLAAYGRLDVVVDDTRLRHGKIERFQGAFFHLKAQGAIIVRAPHGRRATEASGRAETDLWRYISDLVDERAHRRRPPKDKARRQQAFLADAIDSVTLEGKHLVVRNRTPVLAKMREDELDTVLALRKRGTGKTLQQRPPLEFASRCVLNQNVETRGHRMLETYRVPAISLREYGQAVCAPGQVAMQGNLMLPDSFRHHQYEMLFNRFTEDVAPRFARSPLKSRQPETLSGAYFYLDSEWPGHFGHCMTEQMSRLWAWKQAKEAVPELKAVLALPEGQSSLTDFELGIFAAAGIMSRDVVMIDRPVRVERLLAATPMFSMPNYVHPDIEDVWNTVGRALVTGVPEREWSERIFCSRRITKRSCRNGADVEAVFARHGFDVIYPEDYPLAEQAMIFRKAAVVAGFGGSALFTLAFCEGTKRVIVVSSSAYTARNEYMIASVRGQDLHFVWSEPDPAPSGSRQERHPFNSSFTFDFAREGVYLETVLASL